MAFPHRNYFKIPKILVILILSLLAKGQRFAADLFPKDALVFIGESLRLDCILKPTATCVITDVYFSFTSPKSKEPWSGPSENLTVVNNTTVSLLVNINDNFTGATTAECRCMSPEKQLKSIFVHAERPIKNVTDFSGVYLYKDNINLTWKLGQEYLNPFYISVVTKWSPYSPPTDVSNLTCSKNTNESCMILQRDYQDQEIIFVSINVSSTRNIKNRPGPEYLQPIFKTWATSVYKFEVLNNTQCNAPRDLTLTDVDKSCVSVAWKDPSYLVYCTPCQKFFQIQLHGEHEDPLKRINGSYTNANVSIPICDLKPFTKYSLRVQLKGGQPNPWSEWATVEATTLEDRPLTGPPMWSTNYHEENCENNTRRVYLYWNESPRDSLQGESTMFEVSFENKTYQLRKGTNFFQDSLQCEAQYNISVSSATKVGTSIEPSLIFIPKASQALPVPSNFDFQVELFDPSPSSLKNLNITWRAGLHEKDVSLYVYMCQESYQTKICFDELRVIEVNMTEEAIFLTNVTSTANLIGYALRHENGQTRGISWTECVFLRDEVPGKPQGVRVSSGTESGSLEISWMATPCSKVTKTLIVQYIILICSTKETSDSCQSVNVNGSVDSYTATGLLENHHYVVSIQAATPYKLGPTFEVKALTGSKNDSGSGNVITAITATVATAGVLIFIGIIGFFVRRFMKGRKRFQELLDDSLILSKSSTQVIYQPQTSTESGVYTSSQRSQQSCTSESEVQPSQNGPVQPSHNGPVQSPYNGPVQPPHIGPVQPLHNGPVQPPHNEPVQIPHNRPVQPPYIGPVHPTLNSPGYVDQPYNDIALKEISLEVSNEQPSPTSTQERTDVYVKDDGCRPLDEYVRVANGSAGKPRSHYITDNDSLIVPSEPHTHSLPQHPIQQAIYVGLALDGQSPMFPQAEGAQSTVTLGETQQCGSPHVEEYVGFGIQNGQATEYCSGDGSICVDEADGFDEKVLEAINMQPGQDYVSRPHPGYISNMDDQRELRAAEDIHPSVVSSGNERQEVNSERPMDLTDLCTCTGLPCVSVSSLSDLSIAQSSLASECPVNGYVIHNLRAGSVNSSGNYVSQERCGATVNSSNNYVSQLGGSTVNTNDNYVPHKALDRGSSHSYANEEENPNGHYCSERDNMDGLTEHSGTSHLQSTGTGCCHSQEVGSAAVESGKGCDNQSLSLHNDREPLTTQYYPTVNLGRPDGDKREHCIDLGPSDSHSECLHSGHVVQRLRGGTEDSRLEDCKVYSRGSESSRDKQSESDGYTRQALYGVSMRNSSDNQSFDCSDINVGDSENLPDSTAYQPIHFIAGKS